MEFSNPNVRENANARSVRITRWVTIFEKCRYFPRTGTGCSGALTWFLILKASLEASSDLQTEW